MTPSQILDGLYAAMDGKPEIEEYYERHGIASAAILTVKDDEIAHGIADYLADRVRGRTVVEIGGGIGLLALHLAEHAERVYCIEANPAWSWFFVLTLFDRKPKNVSYLFGAADEFEGQIKVDVALFCTHSDHPGMRRTASMFAPEVIDVYNELVDSEAKGNAIREEIFGKATTCDKS